MLHKRLLAIFMALALLHFAHSKPRFGRKRMFGAGMLGGALAGVAVSHALSHHHQHQNQATPANNTQPMVVPIAYAQPALMYPDLETLKQQVAAWQQQTGQTPPQQQPQQQQQVTPDMERQLQALLEAMKVQSAPVQQLNQTQITTQQQQPQQIAAQIPIAPPAPAPPPPVINDGLYQIHRPDSVGQQQPQLPAVVQTTPKPIQPIQQQPQEQAPSPSPVQLNAQAPPVVQQQPIQQQQPPPNATQQAIPQQFSQQSVPMQQAIPNPVPIPTLTIPPQSQSAANTIQQPIQQLQAPVQPPAQASGSIEHLSELIKPTQQTIQSIQQLMQQFHHQQQQSAQQQAPQQPPIQQQPIQQQPIQQQTQQAVNPPSNTLQQLLHNLKHAIHTQQQQPPQQTPQQTQQQLHLIPLLTQTPPQFTHHGQQVTQQTAHKAVKSAAAATASGYQQYLHLLFAATLFFILC